VCGNPGGTALALMGENREDGGLFIFYFYFFTIVMEGYSM